MDNSNRIAELEERKKQIDVEIAFHNGAKIKAKVKLWHGWIDVSSPEFKWETCDYCIAEEPKRIPFDGSDYVNILNKKVSHKLHKFTSILTMVDGSSIVIGDKRFDIIFASEHLQWYNELLNEWKPCTKIA